MDATSIEIRDHLFGPNCLSSAIIMERVDVAFAPSVSISIHDSRFEDEDSVYEMVTRSNVQPTDDVVLESDRFVDRHNDELGIEIEPASIRHRICGKCGLKKPTTTDEIASNGGHRREPTASGMQLRRSPRPAPPRHDASLKAPDIGTSSIRGPRTTSRWIRGSGGGDDASLRWRRVMATIEIPP